MRKFKNKILIGLLKLSIVVAVVSTCLLDSKSIVPIVTCCVSFGYIALFTLANTPRG